MKKFYNDLSEAALLSILSVPISMGRMMGQVKPVSHKERLFLWERIVHSHRKSRSFTHFAPLRRWPFSYVKKSENALFMGILGGRYVDFTCF
ncbi:MAG: hypothetical protein J6W19_12795 [Prevotella sp.]|nr:hypothetical protein [Prevotella sp.]